MANPATEHTLELDIPRLLPGVEAMDDACLARLEICALVTRSPAGIPVRNKYPQNSSTALRWMGVCQCRI